MTEPVSVDPVTGDVVTNDQISEDIARFWANAATVVDRARSGQATSPVACVDAVDAVESLMRLIRRNLALLEQPPAEAGQKAA